MADVTPKKGIWIWALVACWIVVLVAGVAGLAGYKSGPQPTGEPGVGAEVLTYTLGHGAAVACIVGTAIWALFAWTVFIPRTSIAKSLSVLPIMIAVAFCAATPLRFFAMMGRVAERTEVIDAWAAESGGNLARLSNETNHQLAAVGDSSIGAIRTANDIDLIVERARQVELIYVGHQQLIEEEFARTRGEVASMDLTEEEASALLQQTEERGFAPVRRFAEMNVEAARQRTAMLVRLQGARDGWVLQSGQVMFYDEALMTEMRTLAQTHDRLARDIEARRLAMAGAGAPQP